MNVRDDFGRFVKTGRNICSIDACCKIVEGHGYCSMHYTRWKRNGDPLKGGRIKRPDDVVRKLKIENNRKYKLSEKGKVSELKYRNGRGRINFRKHLAIRRQRIKLATPPWVDTAEIFRFYKNKPKGMVVDHIHQLVGWSEYRNHISCGLHVLWNLQYIDAKTNREKWSKINGIS